MIRTLKDTGAEYPISSNVDGAVYSVATQDCIIGGMGDEFAVTTSINSLNLIFKKGCIAVLCGNAFWLTDDVEVILPANSTIYLCLRIDTSKPNGQKGSFECLTEAGIKKDNINNEGIRDFAIYKITTSSNGVTACEDKRIIMNSASYATKDYVDNAIGNAIKGNY